MQNVESISYRRTDLAVEAEIDRENAKGVHFDEYERDSVPVSVMTVDAGEGERAAATALSRSFQT